MPELPEVETVKNGLLPVMQGQVISDLWLGAKGLRHPFQEDLPERVVGREIQALHRRAKYILIYLSGNRVIILHLGMSGRIRILGPGNNMPYEHHDHIKLKLGNNHEIVLNDARRFGSFYDMDENALPSHPSFKSLGPEPFCETFNPENLQGALRDKKTAIKIALMDQRVVVGVGNIYACEALYRAGISPRRVAHSIKAGRAEKLVTAIREVLQEAIASGGSSLRDHRTVYNRFGYFQQKLAVYAREGLACPACSCDIYQTGGVQRCMQGGRSTFYCPRKQR